MRGQHDDVDVDDDHGDHDDVGGYDDCRRVISFWSLSGLALS